MVEVGIVCQEGLHTLRGIIMPIEYVDSDGLLPRQLLQDLSGIVKVLSDQGFRISIVS